MVTVSLIRNRQPIPPSPTRPSFSLHASAQPLQLALLFGRQTAACNFCRLPLPLPLATAAAVAIQIDQRACASLASGFLVELHRFRRVTPASSSPPVLR
mmetsp:Transcript_21705/g.39592  ORF Transcript_21705/g.39592 Transcript_21705/m.39592 type:complete len:99 (-) Transcript_21705:83-379(-)